MATIHWLVDGNNVFGSRPDGWWNNRPRAATGLAQSVAEWCRTHDDPVVLVFDPPVEQATLDLAGGNLRIEAASRRGRDAADDHLASLARAITADIEAENGADAEVSVVVVSSDKGLLRRLPPGVEPMGVSQFRRLIGY